METLKYQTEQEWLQDLTRRLGDLTRQKGKTEKFHVSLSGGSTPKALYQFWGGAELDWERIHWWLGDERWVPVDSDSSNERMVLQALGGKRTDFKSRFHGWHLADEVGESAALFEKSLIQDLGKPPVFDLVLLGLGNDGHTASLFPGAPELKENVRYAVSTRDAHLGHVRLTLTYPCLNAARETWFLVRGIEKKEMVDRLVRGDREIPSGCVRGANQKLIWLLA